MRQIVTLERAFEEQGKWQSTPAQEAVCRIIRKFEDGTHGIIRHCQPDPECADRCFALFYFYAFNNIVHHALAFSLARVLPGLSSLSNFNSSRSLKSADDISSWRVRKGQPALRFLGSHHNLALISR